MYQKAESPKVSTSAEVTSLPCDHTYAVEEETLMCTPLDALCETLHSWIESIFPARTPGCIRFKLLPHNPSPDQTEGMRPFGHSCKDRHGHSTTAHGLWE